MTDHFWLDNIIDNCSKQLAQAPANTPGQAVTTPQQAVNTPQQAGTTPNQAATTPQQAATIPALPDCPPAIIALLPPCIAAPSATCFDNAPAFPQKCLEEIKEAFPALPGLPAAAN